MQAEMKGARRRLNNELHCDTGDECREYEWHNIVSQIFKNIYFKKKSRLLYNKKDK